MNLGINIGTRAHPCNNIFLHFNVLLFLVFIIVPFNIHLLLKKLIMIEIIGLLPLFNLSLIFNGLPTNLSSSTDLI